MVFHFMTFYVAFISVIYHQDGVEFTLEGDEMPGFLKGSKKGNVFITTQKVSHKTSSFNMTVRAMYKRKISFTVEFD